MADYAIGHQGASLRDALNALMPMTGMGNYAVAFPPSAPPAAGSPQPEVAPPAVGPARSQPRIPVAGAQPFQAPGQAIPVPGAIGGGNPLRRGVPPMPQGQTGLQPSLGIEGGAPRPGGMIDPRNYAARLGLGLTRSF